MRQKNCCHVSLAFVLKFLNFLQAFVGVSIIVYSVWMLDQWSRRAPLFPPPSAPSPESSPFDFAVQLVSGFDEGIGFQLNSFKLPAPWFIYAFMGLGVLMCCITFVGCIAAESISGCCLCFYTLLITALTLLEAVLVAFIAIDRHWEKDLPYDPTGELESLTSFIEGNIDICKWVGLAVVGIQALSLLLSMVLRGMVSNYKADFDIEDEYDARGRTWEPLLNQQSDQASGSTKGGTREDIWRSRMREKYGLGSGGQNSSVNQNASRRQ